MSENKDEFVTTLIKELKQHTDALENRTIEYDSDDNELVKDDILLTLHSLKGLFGFLDESYAGIRIIIHQLEDSINAGDDEGKSAVEIKSLILNFADDLKILLARIRKTKSSQVNFSDLFESIKAILTPTLVLDQQYKINIVFTKTSETKSARMLMLINKLKRIATIVETVPSQDNLMGSIEFNEGSITIITRESKQVISESVSRVPEIEGYSISEVNISEISESKTKTSGSLLSSETVEVPINKLDQIIGHIEELVLAGTIIEKSDLSMFSSSDIEILSSFTKKIKDIQDLIFDIKLIPIDILLRPLSRIINDTSESVGNKTKVLISSGNVGLDRTFIEKLLDPVSVIVQNAVIHGIEKPEDRLKLKKSEVGIISISARQEESEVILQISDDGRGIDYDALSAKAISSGAVTEQVLEGLKNKNEILFLKNVSELDQASVFGGRGVGLYGVSKVLEEISSYVIVTSEPNKGTTFEIHIPVVKPIVPVLIFNVGNYQFGIQQTNIEIVERLSSADIRKQSKSFKDKMSFLITNDNGDQLKALNLIEQFYSNEDQSDGNILTSVKDIKQEVQSDIYDNVALIHWKYAGKTVGLLVNSIDGILDLPIDYNDPVTNNIPFLSGSTMIEGGKILLIFNPNPYMVN